MPTNTVQLSSVVLHYPCKLCCILANIARLSLVVLQFSSDFLYRRICYMLTIALSTFFGDLELLLQTLLDAHEYCSNFFHRRSRLRLMKSSRSQLECLQKKLRTADHPKLSKLSGGNYDLDTSRLQKSYHRDAISKTN